MKCEKVKRFRVRPKKTDFEKVTYDGRISYIYQELEEVHDNILYFANTRGCNEMYYLAERVEHLMETVENIKTIIPPQGDYKE